MKQEMETLLPLKSLLIRSQSISIFKTRGFEI